MNGITVKRKFHGRVRGKGRKEMQPGEADSPAPVGKVPRVARLMALAIRFEQLILEGIVADQAELARLGQVTRARLTQIMNLLNLAPEIQEERLFLTGVKGGRAGVTEPQLRPVAASLGWREQRRRWSRMVSAKWKITQQA